MAKGHPAWNKGKPRSEATKKKISEGQQRRWAQQRELPVPDRKRCPKCREWKDSPKCFGWNRRKLKSGEWSYHPRSICKMCQAEKAKAYREQLKLDGTLRDRQAQWYKNRRKKEKEASVGRSLVPAEPLYRWYLRDREDRDIQINERAHPTLARRVRDLKAQKTDTIELGTVDMILGFFGVPELLTELYPLDD